MACENWFAEMQCSPTRVQMLSFSKLGILVLQWTTHVFSQILMQNTGLFQKYPQTDSQKIWHSYVKGFVKVWLDQHSNIVNCSTASSLSRYLWCFKQSMRSFTEASKEVVERNKLSVRTSPLHGHEELEKTRYLHPLRPTGIYLCKYITNRPYKIFFGESIQPIYILYLNVNLKFHLNVTFDHIYFSNKMNTLCKFNHLSVFSCNPHFTICDTIHYCGINPSSQVFSKYSNVRVSSLVDNFVMHSTTMVYSVIPNNFVVNNPHNPRKKKVLSSSPKVIILDSFQFTGHAAVVNVFGMRTTMTNQLVVLVLVHHTMKANSVKCHDGPGPLSREISPQVDRQRSEMNCTFICSTFQCIMFVGNSSVDIKYLSVQNKELERKVHISPGSQIYFHSIKLNLCGWSVLCIFSLSTQKGFHVKVSSSNITVKGQCNTNSCTFSGFGSVDQKSSHVDCPKLPPTGTVSEDKEGSVFLFRDIYSSNSQLTIIYYSFPEYNELNLKLQISTTHCSVSVLNLCENVVDWVDYSNRNPTDNFLQQNAKFLTSQHRTTGYSNKTIQPNTIRNSCRVFQLTHDLKKQDHFVDILVFAQHARYDCLAKIVFGDAQDQETRFAVLGFFTSLLSLYHQKTKFEYLFVFC